MINSLDSIEAEGFKNYVASFQYDIFLPKLGTLFMPFSLTFGSICI